MPQEVACPVRGSIPRLRVVAWHLSQRPGLVRGRRVLHFAPEWGLMCTLGRLGEPADSSPTHRALSYDSANHG